MSCFLGIDTSNYTTSIAVVDENGVVVENRKTLLDVKQGERGLRQSDAVFSHVRNLPQMLSKLGSYKISAVGYSAVPRDLEGSYMPCFLAGKAVAASIAEFTSSRLYSFSHQRGHIRAALYSSGREDLIGKSYVSFHVSGGTTDILHVDKGIVTEIGGTLDLNAGQAIDRAGVLMGMKFPCGPELERIATESPLKPSISVKGLRCNLSGLENKVKGLLSDLVSHDRVAAYVIEFIKATLDKLCENVRIEYPGIEIIFAGGVTSNKLISKHLGDKYGACFAAPAFSADNAAGTALLAYDAYKKDFCNDQR